MNKSEIITLILVFLIAGSSIAYIMYSEDTGRAWYKVKRPSKPVEPTTKEIYPSCDATNPECAKAQALFQLIPQKIDPSTGTLVQGVFDKDKDFTVHQFAIAYDALMALPLKFRNTLKLLFFSSTVPGNTGAQDGVADVENAGLYFGYWKGGEPWERSYMNWKVDRTFYCIFIHEMAHIAEWQLSLTKGFRSICYNTVPGVDIGSPHAWTRKEECEIFKDFAPQVTKYDGQWDNNLRQRSASEDGTEDIANAASYYACSGNLFRAEARVRPKMKEKYLFLKEKLFDGKEYQCDVDGCLTLVLPPTPCANNGCAICKKTGDACTTTCNDCPKLAGCRPGMDCKTCTPKNSECKYWTCKDNKCAINQW